VARIGHEPSLLGQGLLAVFEGRLEAIQQGIERFPSSSRPERTGSRCERSASLIREAASAIAFTGARE
jgi:hypothetical protein